MYSLLRVDASGRGSASVSRAVADTFEAAWLAQLPDSGVVTRDLAAQPVPHLPAELVPRSHGLEVDAVTARVQDGLVDELMAADAVLMSTPMYNLGVPSVLKAWIDHVVLLGRTLVYPGSPAPLAAVPVTVVAAYGGGYGPGAPREGFDHLQPYLQAVLTGIFGMEVAFVTVELTLAASTPGMHDLIGLAEQSAAAGHLAATERAAQVASLVTRRTRPVGAGQTS